MEARDLGERALLARLTRHLTSRANALGFADDCAAVPWGEDFLLATTDALAASTHFPEGITPRQIGRLAAAANLSDLAAKGGEPVGLLLALGVPPEAAVEDLEQVMQGFAALGEAFGAEVLGGDTKPALELTLAVTALGKVPRGQLLRRTGARPGDVLAVTGDLGGAAAGLAALQRGLGLDLAQRLFEPTPRVPEGRALATSGAARASLDLSDGLARGLHQLEALNGAAMVLDLDAVPLHPATLAVARLPDEPWRWACQGGGDYELLVALAPEGMEGARGAVAQAGGRLSVVGRVERGRGVWQGRHGKRRPLADEGWEHFAPGSRGP